MAACCCLTRRAGDYLSGQGVAVSLVNHRLRQGSALAGAPPPPIHLDQAQAVHSFLLQQQRLRRITSAALVLESAPEALCLDVRQHLQPLLACLNQELGLSQEQTTAVFRALRRQRQQAQAFLALSPGELQRRYSWLCRLLGLEGSSTAAAAYFSSQPSLLLAEPGDAAAAVRWLYAAATWRRLALRRNLQQHPAILLRRVAELEAAAVLLQRQLDASVDELCLLLSLAPALLALTPAQLAAAVQQHPTSWQLAAAHMGRPAMMMQDAAEALHMQVATLYVMGQHNMSRQQVADLVRDKPTLLRSLRLY